MLLYNFTIAENEKVWRDGYSCQTRATSIRQTLSLRCRSYSTSVVHLVKKSLIYVRCALKVHCVVFAAARRALFSSEESEKMFLYQKNGICGSYRGLYCRLFVVIRAFLILSKQMHTTSKTLVFETTITCFFVRSIVFWHRRLSDLRTTDSGAFYGASDFS